MACGGTAGADYSSFVLMQGDRPAGEVHWPLVGRHNAQNALAAILPARHAGVSLDTAIAALQAFKGVRRRMELRGVAAGVVVYSSPCVSPA